MSSIKKWQFTIVAVIIFVWSLYGTQFNIVKFLDFGKSINFFLKRWLPPDWSVIPIALSESLITLQIALLGTFFALLIALPISFFAAKNTAPFSWEQFTLFRKLGFYGSYHGVRWILNFIRSVPEIVFGLLLIPTLGLGPFAAVIAIMLHNIGVMGKLFAETIEAADKGAEEAMRAVGARKLFVLQYGILPQIMPNILSHYFYRLEVAVRSSLILGFIGGGGIGNMLFIDFKIFNYRAVAAEVIILMLIIIIIDLLSSIIRKRVT